MAFTEVNVSCIMRKAQVSDQAHIGDTDLVNGVRGYLAHLLQYAFIVMQAVLSLFFLYGYLMQFYIFGIYFLQVSGAVFVGVVWGIGFGPLGLKHFSEAGKRRTEAILLTWFAVHHTTHPPTPPLTLA